MFNSDIEQQFQPNTEMEPVVIFDKSKNKEAHLVIATHYTFEELVENARRINKTLFEGNWALSYIDPTTKQAVPIDKNAEVRTLTEKDIFQYNWNYRTSSFSNIFGNPSTSSNPSSTSSREDRRQQRRDERQQSRDDRPRGGQPFQTKTVSYASFGRRAIAYIIDAVVVSILVSMGFRFLGGFGLFAAAWAYFSFSESSARQATIGKMIMQLRVTDLYGNRLSLEQAAVRNFVKALSVGSGGFIYLIALFTQRRQALHDLLGRTVVLEDKVEQSYQRPM